METSRTPSRYGLLTDEERRLLALVSLGSTPREVAAELGVSLEAVREQLQRLLMKLQEPSGGSEPPTLPPAVSAALGIPIQQPEDVPTHVGQPLRREGNPPPEPA